jgi:hypothetical protein
MEPVFGGSLIYANSIKGLERIVNDGAALDRCPEMDEVVHNEGMPSYPEVYSFDAEGYGDLSYLAVCTR